MTRYFYSSLWIGIFIFLSASAYAAEAPTLQARVTDKIEETTDDSFFTLDVENDLVSGEDRNYTSGVRLSYYKIGASVPKFAHTIDRLLPTFSLNETTGVSYSIGQNIFTPKDITQEQQPVNDRPWAGFLYVSAALNTITRNHVDNVEATFGIVGPAALGRQAQTFIHRHLSNSPRPRGWGNQLKNEPGLMLSWERSWPSKPYKVSALGWTASAVPHIGATIGNVYTYANAGLSFRLNPFSDGWQDDPVRVRPAIPGTGSFLVEDNKIVWYFFGGAETRAIARNIFLDGNTFANSHSVDKKPLVLDLDAGLAVSYGNVRLSYAMIYRTKEFDTQDKASVFGTVSLGIKF